MLGGGLLDVGTRVMFRIVVRGGVDINRLNDAIHSVQVLQPTDISISVMSNANDVDASLNSVARSGDIYRVSLYFGPTIFVFSGHRVLYPSPIRFITSAARIASEYLNINPRASRRAVRVIVRRVELIRDETKVVDLDIGHGRRIKAFHGRAIYVVKKYEHLLDFLRLVRVAEAFGVGKSRGIGFGFVKLIRVEAVRGS